MILVTDNPTKAAEWLQEYIQPKMTPGATVVVTLQGNLGAGKTTLVQEYAKLCGITESLTSPTFPLMNIYDAVVDSAPLNFVHMDLYRIDSEEELGMLDVRKILTQPGLYFIEWAEKLPEVFKDIPHMTVKIEDIGGARDYKIIYT